MADTLPTGENGSSLTVKERALYHQLHPVKLATDVSTSAVGAVLLAQHRLFSALLVLFIPSIITSAYMIAYSDLSKIRDGRRGRYLRRHMGLATQATRFAGEFVVIFGAWFHRWWLIPVGVWIIVLAWIKGWLLEHYQTRRA